MVGEWVERRLAAILAAEVAGYSRLMSDDEEGTHERVKTHFSQLVNPKIEEHRGRIVKNTGDGMLAEFYSVIDAVRCAAETQREVAARNATTPESERVDFRIGINLGDVIAEAEDIYGDGVNIAARLEALAEPGGIWISEAVFREVQGKVQAEFIDIGEQSLKNIARPVRVYRVESKSPDPKALPSAGRGAHSVRAAAESLLPLPDKPSIAVLPFQNLSVDPEQQYFADGMVEEIVTALSRIRWLFVIARNSSFAYKGEAIDVKQIGRELGVRYVLEGAVRKAGDRVRITAQLIEAETRSHLWADRFDGTLHDVFDLQDQIAISVAGIIEPTLKSAEMRRSSERPTNDLTAYDLYLRALQNAQRPNRAGYTSALGFLDDAIARDPNYAPALALAGFCHHALHVSGWTEALDRTREQGVELAARALRASGGDAEALGRAAYTIGYFGEDIAAAITLLDRALELNPSFALGWAWGGWLRLWAGRAEAARPHFETALRLNPRDPHPSSLFGIGVSYFFARRFEEARATLLRSLQQLPGWVPPYRFLAACCAHLGHRAEAREMIERLRSLTPLVLPRAENWRNPDYRGLYLSGLRLAIGETDAVNSNPCGELIEVPMAGYANTYRSSLEEPEAFWAEAAEAIDWEKRWERVLDDSRPPFYRWFAGGRLNTCWNALDRHVAAGDGERVALIWDSPVTDTIARFTYRDMRDRVARIAGMLVGLGVRTGDRVLIYMPMVPEAAMAMLACARIGAIHSVVFGGFAAHELATRIDDAKPRAILCASCGIEVNRVIPYKPLLDAAIEEARSKPEACVVLQRPMCRADLVPGRDHDWQELEAAATPADCVPVAATDPLYILYTSGTTGIPKGVVRDNGGHAVALAWSMRHIYGVKPEEVFWTASDVGWVVGHSYIVYGPLLYGCTSVMYEGKPIGTPDAGAFWRVIEQHKVRVFFTAPTAFRAIKREDPDGNFIRGRDLSQFRALFLAGERADPPTIAWAEEMLRVPVIDHWWQTETGWPIGANCLGIERLPVKHGSCTKPVPGWDVRVLEAEPIGEAKELKPGEIGAIAVKLPLPPGTLPTLWQQDERFVQSYLSAYPGYYQTADAGFIDPDGYIHVMTRTDDIINVAGHRLSTGGIEEVLAAHPDVAECAVMGVADPLKGQVPLGLLVLKAGASQPPETVEEEAVALVRERVGPVASFKTAIVVERLPKTRSGKILRGTMRHIADGEEYRMPATIDDPAILDEITTALARAGFPQIK